MNRVEGIQAAIEGLPPEEYARLVNWFREREREQLRWDEKLDSDSSAGRLDFLFEEAEMEATKHLPRNWPSPK